MVGARNSAGSGGHQLDGTQQEPLITNALNNVALILQTLVNNPPAHQQRTPNHAYFLSEFKKQRPPTFQGLPNPFVADH